MCYVTNLRRQAAKIQKQELDNTTKSYIHNYGNCMLCCAHMNKFNCNIYIPGIICAGLCYTMSLIFHTGLQVSDPVATIFNSQEKAYKEDKDFRTSYDLKMMQLVYEYQQKEHLKLIKSCNRYLSKVTTYHFTSGFLTIHLYMH